MTRAALALTVAERATLEARVLDAVASVDDPEMAGVAITELGLLSRITVDESAGVTVGLLPTFSGCPALSLIARDVRSAVGRIDGITSLDVRFVDEPQWSIERISTTAETALARLGIAVERDGAASGPRCGAVTRRRSLFGPTRCRAVHRCEGCDEVVEVMR